jgi:hypothetical protein
MADPTVTETKRKPGRPAKAAAVPLTETAEFKDAVQAAASKAAAEILASLKANQEGQTRPGDSNFAEGLALAIAQLSSQGTGRAKPVAPEVLKARTDARELMTKLLVEARSQGNVPTYELRNKVYLAETMIEPVFIDPATKEQRPTSIDWQGVPNEAMIPTNDIARAIHEAFSNSIGVVVIDSSKHLKPEHLSVTAGGLVVRAGGHAMRPMQVGGGQADPNAAEGLRVHGRTPGAKTKTIAVLGTVASPARVGAG